MTHHWPLPFPEGVLKNRLGSISRTTVHTLPIRHSNKGLRGGRTGPPSSLHERLGPTVIKETHLNILSNLKVKAGHAATTGATFTVR